MSSPCFAFIRQYYAQFLCECHAEGRRSIPPYTNQCCGNEGCFGGPQHDK